MNEKTAKEYLVLFAFLVILILLLIFGPQFLGWLSKLQAISTLLNFIEIILRPFIFIVIIATMLSYIGLPGFAIFYIFILPFKLIEAIFVLIAGKEKDKNE